MTTVTTSLHIVGNTIKLYDCTIEVRVTDRGGVCFAVSQSGVHLDTYAHLEYAIDRCINQ